MTQPISMTAADQPALWRSSDAAAIRCQNRYLLWTRVHLAVLGATGLIAAWSPLDKTWNRTVSGSVALLMFGALVLGLYLRGARIDDRWFHARALAENVKAAAWLYMMAPSVGGAGETDADKEFLDALSRFRERSIRVERDLVGQETAAGEITPRMREIRSLAPRERLATYDTFRLRDQIDWYRLRAQQNEKAESAWSALILVIEALAVVAAVTRLLTVHEYDPTGGIAAVAAGF